MKHIEKKWYSVIISILLIGFLLILTVWVFTLVMKEFNDNKWLWDGIKAFAWAEASQELALLKIKEKWYGIWDKIEHTISTGSIILSDDPSDTAIFESQKEAFISYDLNVLADIQGGKYTYQASLESNQYSIIPLFYEDDENGLNFVRNYNLIIWWTPDELVWNIISGQDGMWNIWSDILNWKWKSINASWEAKFFTSTVSTFLSNRYNEYLTLLNSWTYTSTFLSSKYNSYLILFNSWNSPMSVTIKSGDKFSKAKAKILSSAQVWKYRHNLETEYDNTKFLNMLKYAVFSN